MPPYLSDPQLGARALSQKLWVEGRSILSGFFVLLSMSLLACSLAQDPQSCALVERESADQPATSKDLARSNRLPAKYDVSQIGQRGIGRGFNLYSSERERKLGDKLAEEMEHSLTIIDDPLITAYLNRIAQALVDHSEVFYKISIRLVYDNDEVNAYSLPGGHLYMTTGMLMNMQSESQLAMVMGHEIAHVAARHDTRTWTR